MYTRRIRIFVLLVFIFVVVNALYKNNAGVITEKEHLKECSWIQLVFKNPIMKNGARSASVVGALVPMHHHQKECWKIRIRRDGKARDFCTKKEVFDRVSMGNTYTLQHFDREVSKIETRDLTNAERKEYYESQKKS